MLFKIAHKLKAQTLYFVIAISTVIAILLSGLILLSSVYLNASNDLDLERKLIWNNKSALNYCLAQEDLPTNKIIDLFGNESDSVRILAIPYGLFYNLSISSFHGRDTVSKTYLLGKKNVSKQTTALYLKNSNKALGVCGKTRLVGDVVISERGIERSYIEGQNFIGRKLFHGKKLVAKNSIPLLQNSIINAIESVFDSEEKFNTLLPGKDSVIALEDQLNLELTVPAVITQYIRGMVFIRSTEQIVLGSNSDVRDCVIEAPSIIVEDGFKGSFQGFATDSIIIGENSELKFPSNLVVAKSEIVNTLAKIVVGEKTQVFGNIALLQEKLRVKNYGIISIQKNAVVNGEVYSQASLELKECTVNGTVLTNNLYLKTASSVYINQLLNVEIDVTKLDSNHVGLGIENKHKIWEVLK